MECPFYTALKNYPTSIAWSDQSNKLNYAEAHQEICKNQIKLRKLKITPNTYLALNSENSIRFLALIFAAHRERVPVIILGSFSTEEGKQSAIKRCNAKELNLNSLNKIDVTEQELNDLKNNQFELNTSGDAVILFTSGSSGIEKGVILSLENIFSSAEASNTCTKLSNTSTWLSSLTLSRIGGLAIAYRTAISGANICFTNELSIEDLENIIRDSSITHASLVPVQLQELMKKEENIKNLKKLTCILLGGAAASEKLLKQIVEHEIPILTTYGMTETSSHISLANLDDPMTRVYSSGKILSHTKVRFRNEKEELSSDSNFTGILEVSGKTLCKRYIDEIGMDKFTKDHWYSTGDIAFLDEDKQLHIIGRSDSMIISGGENIHLREIEIVAERIPGVEAAAAIPKDHPKWGQRPVLFIESNKISKEEVFDALKSKLSKIKIPDDVIVLENLPRISIGKVDYQKLKGMVS